MVRDYTSNKAPVIISQYYLKAVKRLKGVPKNKSDDSTEHSLIEPIYIYLRSLDDDTGDALCLTRRVDWGSHF